MLSLRILKSVFLYFNPGFYQLFIHAGLSACLLIGPFLYLYVASMTGHRSGDRRYSWLILSPFTLLLIGLSILYPHHGEPNNWGPFVPYFYKIWLGFIIAAGYRMRHLWTKVLTRDKLIDGEIWLVQVYCAVCLIYIAYVTSSYTSYIVGALTFSVITYLGVLMMIYRRQNRPMVIEPTVKYQNSNLSYEEAQQHMQSIDALMTTEKVYHDPSLTLSKLSDQLKINSKQISQAINQVKGQNYSQYVAAYRVADAQSFLADPDKSHLKISAIAYEVGFNSLSSFNATFKKIAGMTAHEYRKYMLKSS